MLIYQAPACSTDLLTIILLQDVAWSTVENVTANGRKGVYNWSVYETLFDDLGPDVMPYVFDAVFVYTCRRLIDLSLIAGT